VPTRSCFIAARTSSPAGSWPCSASSAVGTALSDRKGERDLALVQKCALRSRALELRFFCKDGLGADRVSSTTRKLRGPRQVVQGHAADQALFDRFHRAGRESMTNDCGLAWALTSERSPFRLVWATLRSKCETASTRTQARHPELERKM
jgi:hypothetical protein